MESPKKEEELLLFERAAQAIVDADVLLLVTGAGWSADSGLAVYNDLASVPAYNQRGLTYGDVCQPKWMEQEPGLFYGFWGQCFTDYRTTKPHEGYGIMARWRKDKNETSVSNLIRSRTKDKMTADRPSRPFEEVRSEETIRRHTPYDVVGEPAGAFFAFTSNADAHFYDHFPAQEIHDCHGSVELWQCSDSECDSGIWRAPTDFEFVVDKTTMLAPPTKEVAQKEEADEGPLSTKDDEIAANVSCIGHVHGQGQRTNLLQNMPSPTNPNGWYVEENGNWPKCGACHSLARPAIFMFGDFCWKYDMAQSSRWDVWWEAVVDLSQDENIKVCVVEVGCGERIPTCRNTSEQMVLDVLEKGGEAKLVRINPEDPSSSPNEVVAGHLMEIKSRGLRAIQHIDQLYSQKFFCSLVDGSSVAAR